MTYYKIVQEARIVGIGTTDSLRIFQRKHRIPLPATENDAEFIECNGAFYKGRWMVPIDDIGILIDEAKVIAVNEEEYNILRSAIDDDADLTEFISAEEPGEDPAPAVEEVLSETEEVTVEFVRNVKIRELSLACSKAITSGFDLEAGEDVLHYSLTLQDQTNLAAATVQILSGDSEIPYHADGETHRMYSADELMAVINAANTHKTYQLAYFNCLKAWVNSLNRIANIQAVEWGSELPKKYQSSLLKSLTE